MRSNIKTNIILIQYSALKRVHDCSQFKINWTKNKHLDYSFVLWQLCQGQVCRYTLLSDIKECNNVS
jgi:hypothetical protein